MKYSFRTFLCLILITTGFQAQAASKRDHAIQEMLSWEDSGVGFADLVSIVNNEKCYLNFKTYAGCVHAVDYLNEIVADFHKRVNAKPNRDLKTLERDFKNGPTANFESGIVEALEKIPFERNGTILRNKEVVGNVGSVSAGAINVFLSYAFDPHTYIRTKKSLEASSDGQNGFEGVGMGIIPENRQPILMPFENGPAMQAGIKPGDVLTHVNDTAYTALKDPIGSIRGPEGTKVKLTVSRDGRTMDFQVTRKAFVLPAFKSEMLSDMGQKMGYIQLQDFMNPDGCDQVKSSIQNLEAQGAQGLILDLRTNSGGHMQIAQCIVGLFVGRKEVVRMKYHGTNRIDHHDTCPYVKPRDGETDKSAYRYCVKSKITDLPLVVMINARSASASEITAGSLQYYNRAFILGEQSFGKGTAQVGEEIPGKEKVVFFRTASTFYFPDNWTNQINGVMPEFEIPYRMGKPMNDPKFKREGERFKNAIVDSQDLGPRPVQRPNEVSDLKTCMNTKGKADKFFGERHKKPEFFDYQKLKAQDLLNCQLQ